MRRLASALTLFTILGSARASTGDACHTSCLDMPQGVTFCTTAARVDTTAGPDPTHVCGCYTGGFDIPNATLYTTACSSFGTCHPRVTVEDDFTLSGLPPGTPVAFTARFEVALTGSNLMGPGSGDARVVEGASNTSSVHHNLNDFYGNTVSTPLSVPVIAIVGTPFHILYEVTGVVGELCYVEWHGTFLFADLPSGVAVNSCNGFVQAATPAHPVSWGSLKAAYR
ncbi:MAG: hypothetical protein ABI960_09695 [Candidatus Eisenbacteria bacterium]